MEQPPDPHTLRRRIEALKEHGGEHGDPNVDKLADVMLQVGEQFGVVAPDSPTQQGEETF